MGMTTNNRPPLICTGCGKTPRELSEYVSAVRGRDLTPDDYVWREEGTLNQGNGHFTCTDCYVRRGMPSSERGWMTP